MDNWWRDGVYQDEEAPEEEDNSSTMPGSSNRVIDGADNGAGQGDTPTTLEGKVDDLTAVAAMVASRVAALNVSLLAKAYEKLVNLACPSSGEMTNRPIALGFHMNLRLLG